MQEETKNPTALKAKFVHKSVVSVYYNMLVDLHNQFQSFKRKRIEKEKERTEKKNNKKDFWNAVEDYGNYPEN